MLDYSLVVEAKGKLPHCTDLGGYPLYYIDNHNNVYCDECATKSAKEIVASAVHWEGEPHICEECNTEIESAYGNPEEEN